MTTATLECAQASCPLRIDGTCLDGFADPTDCPNTEEHPDVTAADESIEDDDDAPTSEDESDVLLVDEHPIAPRPTGNPTSYIGGDQALSMSEAGEITASRPSTVVLVAGDYGSGKTTLVVELWAQFLSGAFHGWQFAGSRTLAAFDRRHSPSRLSSGRTRATTERTRDDDMRLLHLELASDSGLRKSLLFSDVKGEFFGDLVHGQSVTESVPIAERADLCILVVDGQRLTDPAGRAGTFWRSRLLLGALTDPGGLRPGTRLLLLVSKSDLLTSAVRSEVEEAIDALSRFATERGLDPHAVLVSARPDDSEEDPQGLELVMDWVTLAETATAPEDLGTVAAGGRYFWRASAG